MCEEEKNRNPKAPSNSSYPPLTVEDVLNSDRFKHFSPEQAQEYIENLAQFCHMCIELYQKQQAKDNDLNNENLAA